MITRDLCALCAVCGLAIAAGPARAQSLMATRLAILQAEDRRASNPRDLAVIRSGARSTDAQTSRIAVRALGRLERPALIADIVVALRHTAPEVRLEAATAVGQAAQGWKRDRAAGGPGAPTLDAVITTLETRLKVESESDVRAALCETIGRLPFATAAQAEHAERALVEERSDSVVDRLGVAKGFEALARTPRALYSPADSALALLRRLAMPVEGEPATATRIRRLSVEALISAGGADDEIVIAAAKDPDAQVRRLGMRAAAVRGASSQTNPVVAAALTDDSPIVRLEALRTLRTQKSDRMCEASIAAASDADVHVALAAIDQLAGCDASPEAIALLERVVSDRSAAESPRGWHRSAHALVSLAAASPDRGAEALKQLAGSRIWQVRMYGARAAAALRDRENLERFAHDDNDNVREAAIVGLKAVAGHDADDVFVSQLGRGYQVIRVAAGALDGSPYHDKAVPALKAAANRLAAEGHDNSHDAREAIEKALASLRPQPPNRGSGDRTGLDPSGAKYGRTSTRQDQTPINYLNSDDLRRLASPKARVTISDVGTFELALFTAQAPATVLRFAHLAEIGYYNGLTFHRVVANFVIQGGSPGANEYIGDAAFMRDELGSWPHVRGAVGISTRGRDTGDAQIFIDLVDNPRLDHDYTVFAQVLNGIEVVDRIIEGDVIERIEIVPGP